MHNEYADYGNIYGSAIGLTGIGTLLTVIGVGVYHYSFGMMTSNNEYAWAWALLFLLTWGVIAVGAVVLSVGVIMLLFTKIAEIFGRDILGKIQLIGCCSLVIGILTLMYFAQSLQNTSTQMALYLHDSITACVIVTAIGFTLTIGGVIVDRMTKSNVYGE